MNISPMKTSGLYNHAQADKLKHLKQFGVKHNLVYSVFFELSSLRSLDDVLKNYSKLYEEYQVAYIYNGDGNNISFVNLGIMLTLGLDYSETSTSGKFADIFYMSNIKQFLHKDELSNYVIGHSSGLTLKGKNISFIMPKSELGLNHSKFIQLHSTEKFTDTNFEL